MKPPALHLNETASQTAGPYVHIGLAPLQAGFEIFENNFGNVLAKPDTPGERIVVEGRVIDGSGTPLRDVLIELWQAGPDGRHDNPAFRGWGRTGADFESGLWRFETVKPGPVPAGDGAVQAPHLSLWIVARGINIGLNTRMYFSDEAAANERDPVLAGIEWEARRRTLVGQRQPAGPAGQPALYRFDIVLQSADPTVETVFFDV